MPALQRASCPQRVLLFIHSLHGGGAERVAVDLSAHWARAGRDVMVVTQAGKEDDAYALDPKVSRAVLNTVGEGGGLRGIWSNVRRVRALRRVIREFHPDIVLGMMTTASVLSVIAGAGPVPRHCHRAHASAVAGHVRLLAAPAPLDLSEGRARGGADKRHRSLDRNARARLTAGRDPQPGALAVAAGRAAQQPEPRPGRRRLLAVGRLHQDKGFDLLIQAFKQLASAHPDWDLVILGEGGERAALEAQLRQSGMQDRVWMPGRVGNVGDWYASADLYVLTSRFEGLSNTLLESMASGLAAVCFDCDTGPREVVRDGVDGVLVRPNGDVPALCAALDAVMGDDAMRARMAAAATDVRDRFSANRVLARWEELLTA